MDLTSVRNMLVAFGEFLPVPFWLSHLPADLFEAHDRAVTAPETIDWPLLTMMVCGKSVLGDSVGMWNRSRILSVLYKSDGSFYSAFSKSFKIVISSFFQPSKNSTFVATICLR
ncbi:hypothetical protein ASPZODRAFT_136958 [Penicilliopsis zonata CBS 506.65]|uniref:Uncharacterized protein n=1 Tax=Penicilliopsis zonata CBS 506.65 TaxID=1073090 RepID=A0A1L9S6T0_9EURO|nr:hypothetical protein ASPZODRAFT_136958 [Penicilliopsis zonata CBS 506.65]OJJ42825.1 hypothetical protein ASPZODRAFT_136958 [Penicilliopsis zonata CBS 506.65]